MIVLVGLALFILFAAVADRGEAEVETVIITRPAQPQRRMFPTIILTVMLALLILMALGRMAEVVGQ